MMSTALLVLDVQNIYSDPNSEYHCKGFATTIEKINRLGRVCRIASIPSVLGPAHPQGRRFGHG